MELAHVFTGDAAEVAALRNYSLLLDKYDINVHMWIPVDNAAVPLTAAALQQYEDIFGNMTRLDAIQVPGGDGGPGFFSDNWWSALQAVSVALKRWHPQAKFTCSANSFNANSLGRFFAAIAEPETATWLDGVQLGKEEPLPLKAFIARVRAANPRYAVSRVPDITHTVLTGFAIPEWDYVWASTMGREAINPAPKRFEQIIRLRANGSFPTVGYIAYSEGLNDDFNKCLWSALTMEPSLSAEELARQYARTFFGAERESAAALGLLGLERNWIGPAAANGATVAATLARWDAVAARAPPGANWRLDMHRYRATVDAYVQSRLVFEGAGEAAARGALATAAEHGADQALAAATQALANASAFGTATARGRQLKQQCVALRDAINRSAALCPGCGGGHGGTSTVSSQAPTLNLQNIDSPLSSAPWLGAQMESISRAPASSRVALIGRLLSPYWPVSAQEFATGSFYDWVGSADPREHPHLLPGPGAAADPQHFYTPLHSASGCTGRHYTPGAPATASCDASVPIKRKSKVSCPSRAHGVPCTCIADRRKPRPLTGCRDAATRSRARSAYRFSPR